MVALVCPSCDHAPESGAAPGSGCTACGAKLVRVAEGDALIGSVLDGRFQIRERLGSGAMGVVYRATQLSIGRDVAVKLMTGMDVSAVKRFFREAQIASALAHPNTVQIIEFGQHDDGRVYLAMELVRGTTLLDELNERGAFPSRRLCHIGGQLCDALEAAHRLTIVHRDLKPENVMIASDGSDHVKILDFGIARVLGDAASRVTSAGLSAGTPNYMAPEVLGEGAEPEPPQDMYALGVMLGELALGRPLWSKTSLELLFVEKTTNAAVASVPARMRPLVRRLMDPDPAKRPTATETRKLLRELDRTATDPVGIAATAHIAPVEVPAPVDMSALDNLAVVDLAEATGAPALAPTPAIAKPPPIELLQPDLINVSTSDAKLELDTTWERERATKKPALSVGAQRVAAEHARRPAPARSSSAWPLLVVLVLAGLGGAAYYVFVLSKPTEPPAKLAPDRGVTIRIVGKSGTPITIDGKPAGKTPVSLQRRPGKKAFVIGANGSTWQIVPDHDQTIDVENP